MLFFLTHRKRNEEKTTKKTLLTESLDKSRMNILQNFSVLLHLVCLNQQYFVVRVRSVKTIHHQAIMECRLRLNTLHLNHHRCYVFVCLPLRAFIVLHTVCHVCVK